jgi:polar amino acid transport system substrate-binding protein
MTSSTFERRNLLKGAAIGATALAAGGLTMTAQQAAAQSSKRSLLRDVLDKGTVRVGTGSTNAPWHFEDEQGKLVGMDITMARILAKGLFDDDAAFEFVQQDPAARIPNINTGKVDIVIQFMTATPQRAQLVAFTRPYYVEGVSLMSRPDGKLKEYDKMLAAGSDAKVSVLQNIDAERLVHQVLPEAQVLMLDTQANVIQALESGRVDGAAIDLSTVGWMVKRNPNRYHEAGKRWFTMLYAAAVRQGDQDWLNYVNMTFDIAMFGHQNDIYDQAFFDYFGAPPPKREPGFPVI